MRRHRKKSVKTGLKRSSVTSVPRRRVEEMPFETEIASPAREVWKNGSRKSAAPEPED
jgi:hypothetical protein